MRKYTFFILFLGASITVSANNKHNALAYVKNTLNLTQTDKITLLGVNL